MVVLYYAKQDLNIFTCCCYTIVLNNTFLISSKMANTIIIYHGEDADLHLISHILDFLEITTLAFYYVEKDIELK